MLDPCPPGYFVMPYTALKEALNHNVASCTAATVVTLRSGLSIWFHPIIWYGKLNANYNFYWQHSYWQADDVVPEGRKGSAYVHRDNKTVTRDNNGGLAGGFPVRAVRSGRCRAAFMGDSITANWGGAHENENVDDSQKGDSPFFIGNGFINRGVSGNTTSQMLARFDEDIVANHPPKVVIMGGTNDLAGNDNNKQPRSSEHILGNLSAMAQKALNGGASEVLLCSVLPVSQYNWSTAINPMPLIKDLNAKIKAYCDATPSCTYVDYYSALLEKIILPYLQ